MSAKLNFNQRTMLMRATKYIPLKHWSAKQRGVLKRLEQRGLVRSDIQPGVGTVWFITDAGRQALEGNDG